MKPEKENFRWSQLNPTRSIFMCLLLFSCIGLTGCAENPGKWGPEKLQVEISERLELVEAEVQPAEEGGYHGTGKRQDGEVVAFTITQQPEKGRMSWDAKGDRGFVEDGYYELK